MIEDDDNDDNLGDYVELHVISEETETASIGISHTNVTPLLHSLVGDVSSMQS